MVITNAKYKKELYSESNNYIEATIDGAEVSVPMDTANRHYAEILRQVEAGTLVIQEAE
jgi:hypothetical protein